jgi:hypothetical protein
MEFVQRGKECLKQREVHFEEVQLLDVFGPVRKSDVITSQAGESVVVWWYPSAKQYQMRYYRPGVRIEHDSGVVVGECKFSDGLNVASFSVGGDKCNPMPEFFESISWRSTDYGGEDSGGCLHEGLVDQYSFIYYPTLGFGRFRHDAYRYPNEKRVLDWGEPSADGYYAPTWRPRGKPAVSGAEMEYIDLRSQVENCVESRTEHELSRRLALPSIDSIIDDSATVVQMGRMLFVPGDIDNSGDIDPYDLSAWESAYWRTIGDQEYICIGDFDGDGLIDDSDLWGTLQQDSDNDGSPDASEIVAGTNPADRRDFLLGRVAFVAPDQVRLSWMAVSGRNYAVWRSQNPSGVPRIPVARDIVGVDGIVHWPDSIPKGSTEQYYWIQVTR